MRPERFERLRLSPDELDLRGLHIFEYGIKRRGRLAAT